MGARDGTGGATSAERIDQSEEGGRTANLRHELQQLDVDVAASSGGAKTRSRAGARCSRAPIASWEALAASGVHVERTRPEPPYILSVELVNAGPGESILIHYGTPDDIKLIMINAGPRASFRESVAPRLRALSTDRFEGRPVPIELFIVGDRDEDKTGGLERLLSGRAEPTDTNPTLVDIRGIWANIFGMEGGNRETFRSHIRKLIDEPHIPLNQPFDRLIARPERGRAQVTLPGGLEVIVLGPAQMRLDALHKLSADEARRVDGTIEPLILRGSRTSPSLRMPHR